jgi:beta-barrel assembly-enhancing protease
MHRISFVLVLALLAAGVVLATIGSTIGSSGHPVNFGSLLSLWSDALRDTDQIGMRLTRLSDADEMRIGSELVRSAPFPLLAPDAIAQDVEMERYVSDVAQTLLPRVRRPGIHYQFHVVASPEVNAFSLPGGHVFVTSGMLGFVESEAELAAVLGHEIAHVDLRHCVERYQYEYRLKKVGAPDLGWMLELAHRLATTGFSSDQELEADARGEALAIQAGYDPDAMAALFERMKARFHEPAPRAASTPAGEVAQAAAEAVGSYFRTHPPFAEREQQLAEMTARHQRELKGRSFYVGKENLKTRTARAKREWRTEFHSL